MDFAGLVQLSERSNDLDPSFGQIHHICGGAKGLLAMKWLVLVWLVELVGLAGGLVWLGWVG